MQLTALTQPVLRLAVATLLISLTGCALWNGEPAVPPSARTLPGESTDGQVVDPNVQGPTVSERGIKPENYEVGPYTGLLLVSSRDKLGIYGLRVGYHKSDDLWVEANIATASEVGYKQLRKLFGVSKPLSDDLTTIGLSVGYNLLPGDLYVTPNYTLPLVLYGIGGAGYTNFDNDSFADYNFGVGLKMFPTNWLSVRMEIRDDIFAQQKATGNPEFTLGLAAFF